MSKKKISEEEKLFNKRSRAAKKGWRTRRANIKAKDVSDSRKVDRRRKTPLSPKPAKAAGKTPPRKRSESRKRDKTSIPTGRQGGQGNSKSQKADKATPRPRSGKRNTGSQKRPTKAKTQKASLKAEKRALKAEKQAFEARRQALESKAQDVEAEQRALESKKQNVEAEQRALENKKQNVEAEQRALENEKRALETKKALLEQEKKDIAEALTWTADPVTHNKKGELALFPSTLRIEENRDSIEKTLRNAEREGNLDEIVNDIADQYDIEVQEVYSFFFSP